MEKNPPIQLEMFPRDMYKKRKRQYKWNKPRKWKRKTFDYFDSFRLWGRRYSRVRKDINSLECKSGKKTIKLFFKILEEAAAPFFSNYAMTGIPGYTIRRIRPPPEIYESLLYCFNKFFSREIIETEKELRRFILHGDEELQDEEFLQKFDDAKWDAFAEKYEWYSENSAKSRKLAIGMLEYIVNRKRSPIKRIFWDFTAGLNALYYDETYQSSVDISSSTYEKGLFDLKSYVRSLYKDLYQLMSLQKPVESENAFVCLENYLGYASDIFRADHSVGIVFAEQLWDMMKYFSYDLTRVDQKHFIKEYYNAVKFLLEKTKAGNKAYKPEGLLARILEPENKFKFIRAFIKPVLLNYLYEGRLPAHSWSAGSGKEMAKALTTGDYKSSYDAEKKLIDKVNREIYSKHPLGK